MKYFLTKTYLYGAKYTSTLIASRGVLSRNDRVSLNSKEAIVYRSLVGTFQYYCKTMPKFAFLVNKLCEFLSAPTIKYWQAIKRTLRYLQSRMHFRLKFSNSLVWILWDI